MNHQCQAVWIVIGFVLCGWSGSRIQAQENVTAGFRVQEFLGHTWRDERVQFPLTAELLQAARNGRSLVRPDGAAEPYQLTRGDSATQARIEFLASLHPFEIREYRFVHEPATVRSNLQIDETGDRIRLSNGWVGISIAKTLQAGAGPMEGVQLESGQWIGGSRLESGQGMTGYSAEVTARGPVHADVLCRATFDTNRTWEMRLRLQVHEPVVLVDETYTLQDDSAFVLSLSKAFSPDGIFYRHGAGNVGTNASERIVVKAGEPLFVLEPWLHWWERERQGTWLGLYNDSGTDLLMLGAREPGVWVDPQQPRETQSPPRVTITSESGELVARFPLRGGTRQWMIGAFDNESCLSIMRETVVQGGRGPVAVKHATLPQKFVIKHGDFPLDRVKDYVLDWPGDDNAPARLFVSREDVQRFRARFKPDPLLLAKYRRSEVVTYDMDGPVSYYLGTDDPELGRHLADQAVALVQKEVDQFLTQAELPTLGVEPHHRANDLLPAVNLAALMLDSRHTAPELKRRLRAQLAFLGYTVTRPDFYSPARGYSANPNMTSTVAAFQVQIAGAIPSHPMSAEWIKGGLNELRRELDQWSDENGGWLEAPHYAIVAYDYLLACELAAHHAGLSDDLYDPKMKHVMDWLGKISTPPNSRVAGRRLLPPIGNTYVQEPTGEFGLMAYLWRDKDPEFAARMQWMYRQQGSFSAPGIGGFYPSLAGFRTVLLDPSIPEMAPNWKSELFPQTGVILRHGFPTNRETQLHLIAGRNHDHYDDDSGSITLWGKGRLLANDFGYSGASSADDHSLVVSKLPKPGVMQVQEFATTDNLDYVIGTRGGWTRQIAFVKDRDPLGANYFVLCDSLSEPASAKWQLWLTADRVTLGTRDARVEGSEDVDLDVFFAVPQQLQLTTETKSRTCPGLLPNGNVNSQLTTTQTALIATSNADRFLVVLSPRLKTETPPVITPLADGKAVKVRSGERTDYVFLSPTAFSFTQDDITFEGTVGTIQLEPNRIRLSLGSAGRVTAKGHELVGKQATSQEWGRSP